jgi:NAD binding domain of 6-phosphogluconate dehydrogenase
MAVFHDQHRIAPTGSLDLGEHQHANDLLGTRSSGQAGGDDHQRGAGEAVTQAWYTCQELRLRIARHLRPGTTLIDASTIGPQAVEEVAALLPGSVALIDAPVMGSADRVRLRHPGGPLPELG